MAEFYQRRQESRAAEENERRAGLRESAQCQMFRAPDGILHFLAGAAERYSKRLAEAFVARSRGSGSYLGAHLFDDAGAGGALGTSAAAGR